MAPGEYARVSDSEELQPYVDDDDDEHTLKEDRPPSRGSAKSPLRPHTYYDDGPFDAPSSESEDDTLFDKNAGPNSPGMAESGLADMNFGNPKSRNRSLRFLLLTIGSLIFLAIIIGVIAAKTYRGTSFAIFRGSKPLTMDHVFNGTFYAQHQSVRWVPEAGDGVYAEMDSSRTSIVLVDLKTNSTRNLVNLNDIITSSGSALSIVEWKISPNMQFLLVKTDYKKQWRHSSFGNYYIHNIEAKSTYPLITPSQPPVTAYATWSPTGEGIAFVHDNDLYVKPNAQSSTSSIRLTTTGSETHFNGVPDWVYEEEVFSADYALWWSPDSKRVAYLESDETDVDVYTFPIYNPDVDSYAVHPYTEETAMRYPKPGYNNPVVDVHVFDLDSYLAGVDAGSDRLDEHTSRLTWPTRHPRGESIVSEVAWVSAEHLIVKEVNRAGNEGSVVLFDTRESSLASTTIDGVVVRKLGENGEEGDAGWIDHHQAITPLSDTMVSQYGLEGPAYLDMVNDTNGYLHIALFSPADSSEPKFVTNGTWEVVGNILGIDPQGTIYFTAAYPTSIERSIMAAPIPSGDSSTTAQLVPLTDISTPAWYEADFSPEAGFYVLGYRGPNVPWQSIFKTSAPPEEFEHKLSDNARLNASLAEYQTPLVVHSTIEVDGFELNVMELIPPYFDDSGRTKYPVLFRVYGGPGSQMVHTRFEVDWHSYLVCSLKYVIVVVDGRGTGFKGRTLRNPIKGNMGNWETQDQVEAARIWASKPYVDPKRIGIWGWSYGGFMSSKVVEANAGVHSLAMAVAPVTSWRLYDSIYTERYMSTPALNPTGYEIASITNMTGFHNAHYLLAHGSGDDNVHFANSAHLLDMLTRDHVRGFRFRMFTDSDHSINTRGANRELYEWMTEFLLEKWGVGGKKRQF